jgi:two-component system sensor histidine kinase DegS
MDGAADRAGAQLDQLYAESKQVVSYAANEARAIATRYREAYADVLATLRLQRRELDALAHQDAEPDDEAGQARLQLSIDATTAQLGERQMEQAKLELVIRHLEHAWLFLQQGDSSLVSGDGAGDAPTEVQMRILEAQESERQRLAQEVHDGPAQALTNAIFQVEFIDRLLERDPVGARVEIRYLRDLLRRELGDVRALITQLRPSLLDELGLYGAIRDQAGTLQSSTGVDVEVDLAAPLDLLGDTQQTVMLRITQEALQNVRRHADAHHVGIATRLEGGDWVLEIEDDGRGFDPDVVREGAGRSFGLQFMRERAELIGARLVVVARPAAGTRVCVTLPAGADRR